MDNAVGATIATTSARTLYWTVTTEDTVTGNPQVAFLGPTEAPTASTVFSTATWTGPETIDGDGNHVRTLSRLVAGPDGPTTGTPVVVPAAGEYSTWVRLSTATDRLDLEGQLLSVQ